MSEQDKELTREELEQQNGEQLPPREVMSIIDTGDGGIYTLPVEPPDAVEAS
ncbi:MAG TPA: hypothetical protein VM049_02460 [Gaiellaceae bacterium]|nr:hypothetical protein [Gaiellaceae bacterium]